jgi:arsenate reductase
MFSDTFAGIDPSSVLMFVLMQVVGGALGLALVRFLWPHTPATPTLQESR